MELLFSRVRKDFVKCVFVGVLLMVCITRHKRHLVGAFKMKKECPSCSLEIRDEIRTYMSNKIVSNKNNN